MDAIKGNILSILPALIGISIHKKKCYYLSWISSESGPLIIDYGMIDIKNNKIPVSYFLNRVIKKYNIEPHFTVSLSNHYVKYNFIKLYNDLFIDNWNRNNYYDEFFHNLYDSYIYDTNLGEFNIHILQSIKKNIISQIEEAQYTLSNLSVGIFSALEGIKCWYNIGNINKYVILKLSRRRNIELLSMKNSVFLSYVTAKKKADSFEITSFHGDLEQRDKMSSQIDLIFNGKLDLVSYEKIFYYSIDGSKEDMKFLTSIHSDKIILIDPFKNLMFDDSCNKNMTKIDASAYSELGNAFGGIDV